MQPTVTVVGILVCGVCCRFCVKVFSPTYSYKTNCFLCFFATFFDNVSWRLLNIYERSSRQSRRKELRDDIILNLRTLEEDRGKGFDFDPQVANCREFWLGA